MAHLGKYCLNKGTKLQRKKNHKTIGTGRRCREYSTSKLSSQNHHTTEGSTQYPAKQVATGESAWRNTITTAARRIQQKQIVGNTESPINNLSSGNADGNHGERQFTRAGSAVSLSYTKEATDFKGNICARNWVDYLKNKGQIHNLNDDCLRMLFLTKLKSDAQRWLHNLI